MILKSDGQEKVWWQKNCEPYDTNFTATMLNTMDRGAAGARNGLGNLRFIDAPWTIISTSTF